MTESSTDTLGPGGLAVTPGTDFVTFATGGGANVADMPSYLADPQRQTGNLPGVARSNFNNRALRQGSFVASGVSTFIWQVLSIYVPDDGNIDNWVASFKAALQSYITPGGTLPGGPYLPLAGGQMSGNITFSAGTTAVLPNNTFLRALDTGGTAHGLIRYGSDNNVAVGDGSSPLILFGSTPSVGSGIFWSARDTGGTNHQLLGISTDNNTYLNAFNNLFVNASTIWTNCNFVIPNNSYYYGKNAAAAPVALLGVRNDNTTLIAQGAPGETWIHAASGARIVLNNPVTVVGTLSTAVINVGGALNVTGNVILSAMLQVNGATNLYSRLNVNNSVGATITGDIATNSIHVYGGSPGLQIDTNANIGGTTNLNYCAVYGSGANDPLLVSADSGHYARIRYNCINTRLWSAGASYDGSFWIADETAGAIRFTIDTAGNVSVGQGVYANALVSYGDVRCNGNLYISTAGYYLYYAGSGFIGTNGNFVANQINANGDIYSSSLHATYNVNVGTAGYYLYYAGGGTIATNSNFYTGQITSNADIYCNSLRANNSLFAGGTQLYNNGGWVYTPNGLRSVQILSDGQITGANITATGQVMANYFYSSGSAQISWALNVGGPAGFANDMTVSGNIGCNNITINGQIGTGGSLGIAGSVTINGNLGANYGSFGGALGVGLTLSVAGNANIAGTVTCNNLVQTSDDRVKGEVEPLAVDALLDSIKALRPVSYFLRDSEQRSFGFLASDVAETPLRGAVHHNEEDGLDYVSYSHLLTAAVGAIQRLAARVEQLEGAA